MQALDRQRAKRLLLVQLLVLLAVTVVAIVVDGTAGISAGLGGLASFLPNVLFAFWVFTPYRAQNPGELLTRFYGGELIKLLLTVMIFVAVFMWFKSLNVVAFFIAYFIVQVLSPVIAHRYMG